MFYFSNFLNNLLTGVKYMRSSWRKIPLFWILQIGGWFALFLIYVLLYYRDRILDFEAMAGLFLTYLTGCIASIFLRLIYRKVNYKNRSIPALAGIVIISSVIFANIWYWLDIFSSSWLHPLQFYLDRNTFRFYTSSIWSNSYILVMWSAFYFIIKLWQEWTEQKERTLQANSLAHQAQLQMLRYQLNPHFLFNSLNSIRALIEEDKGRAKSMITELSEFLRYSLISKDYSNVPLSNELEAMQHYFEIEKTRYEEKLEVNFDIEPAAEDYPVLSFMIHPLIENAIKYGMQTSDLPLKIEISAKVRGKDLLLSVSNTGSWVDSDHASLNTGTGTGLANVQQRLQNAFPGRHKFSIEKNEGPVKITIEILNQAEGENE
jgi:LytS/YehU family sensor histidine kinase